ncbi:hypothetical protein ACOMHN_001862 [Nucella lapillus]
MGPKRICRVRPKRPEVKQGRGHKAELPTSVEVCHAVCALRPVRPVAKRPVTGSRLLGLPQTLIQQRGAYGWCLHKSAVYLSPQPSA